MSFVRNTCRASRYLYLHPPHPMPWQPWQPCGKQQWQTVHCRSYSSYKRFRSPMKPNRFDLAVLRNVTIPMRKIKTAKSALEQTLKKVLAFDITRRKKIDLKRTIKLVQSVIVKPRNINAAFWMMRHANLYAEKVAADRWAKPTRSNNEIPATASKNKNSSVATEASPIFSPRQLDLYERRKRQFQQDGQFRIRNINTAGKEAYLASFRHLTEAKDRAQREFQPAPLIRRYKPAGPEEYLHTKPSDPGSLIRYTWRRDGRGDSGLAEGQ